MMLGQDYLCLVIPPKKVEVCDQKGDSSNRVSHDSSYPGICGSFKDFNSDEQGLLVAV